MSGVSFYLKTLAKTEKKCYNICTKIKIKQKSVAYKQISSQRYSWLNLVHPKMDDITYLREQVGSFDTSDLESILAHSKRPKIEIREKYIFLVLLFPIYNSETREIESEELDIFLNKEWLITVHDNKLKRLSELFETCQGRTKTRDEYFQDMPLYLLENILNRLISYTYALLDTVSNDIEAHDKKLFTRSAKRLTVDILVIRRNITEFRRIMQTHKNTLRKLVEIIKTNGLIDDQIEKTRLATNFNDVIERVKDVWGQLEGYKESIEALHETNESLMSNRLNDIMRSFTTISVLIFTMTLVATIFGLGAGGTPVVGSRYGFWIIIFILLIAALAMLQYFRRKQWLK
ncbi:CorA family divalent cation transporter [Patescibacteria group bacterium]